MCSQDLRALDAILQFVLSNLTGAKYSLFNFNQVYRFYYSPPLTPSKIKQCVQNIWENEKLLFSEHFAMVFPGEYSCYRSLHIAEGGGGNLLVIVTPPGTLRWTRIPSRGVVACEQALLFGFHASGEGGQFPSAADSKPNPITTWSHVFSPVRCICFELSLGSFCWLRFM